MTNLVDNLKSGALITRLEFKEFEIKRRIILKCNEKHIAKIILKITCASFKGWM